jgi:hypothetical protein
MRGEATATHVGLFSRAMRSELKGVVHNHAEAQGADTIAGRQGGLDVSL